MNYSGVASSISVEDNIHMFVFRIINSFWNLLFLWSVNKNIAQKLSKSCQTQSEHAYSLAFFLYN